MRTLTTSILIEDITDADAADLIAQQILTRGDAFRADDTLVTWHTAPAYQSRVGPMISFRTFFHVISDDDDLALKLVNQIMDRGADTIDRTETGARISWVEPKLLTL